MQRICHRAGQAAPGEHRTVDATRQLRAGLLEPRNALDRLLDLCANHKTSFLQLYARRRRNAEYRGNSLQKRWQELYQRAIAGNDSAGIQLAFFYLQNYAVTRKTRIFLFVSNVFLRTKKRSIREIFNRYAGQAAQGGASRAAILIRRKRNDRNKRSRLPRVAGLCADARGISARPCRRAARNDCRPAVAARRPRARHGLWRRRVYLLASRTCRPERAGPRRRYFGSVSSARARTGCRNGAARHHELSDWEY